MTAKSASLLAVVLVRFLAEKSRDLKFLFILKPLLLLISLIYGVFLGHAKKFDKELNSRKVKA